MRNNPEISVIIPSLNEEKYIGELFKGLNAQSFKNFEAIVVDFNSADKTRSIAKRNGAKVILLRQKGIGRARNVGAEAAKGKILVFLDADTMPSKDLLLAYHAAFKNSRVVAATGPIFPLERTSRKVRMGYKVVSVYFVKSSIKIGRPAVVGSNFAVRREVFDRVGGFNPNYATYEDWDLSLRIRKQGSTKFLNDAVVYTSVRRISEWGITRFFTYHTGNILRYNLMKRPKKTYKPIR